MLFNENKSVENIINLVNVYWYSCQSNILTFQHSYVNDTYKDQYTLVIQLPFNIKWSTFERSFGKNVENINYLQHINLNIGWSDINAVKEKVISVINTLLDSNIESLNIQDLITKENIYGKRKSDDNVNDSSHSKIHRL